MLPHIFSYEWAVDDHLQPCLPHIVEHLLHQDAANARFAATGGHNSVQQYHIALEPAILKVGDFIARQLNLKPEFFLVISYNHFSKAASNWCALQNYENVSGPLSELEIAVKRVWFPENWYHAAYVEVETILVTTEHGHHIITTHEKTAEPDAKTHSHVVGEHVVGKG